MITTRTRSHVATSSPHIFISLMQVGSVCSNSILHPLAAYLQHLSIYPLKVPS